MYSLVKKIFVLSLMSLSLIACDGSTEVSDARYSGLVKIQGKIEVAADTSVDLDVESTCSTLEPRNNDYATAQQISNPLTIGGYLNGEAFSEGGCNQYHEDLDDTFSVSLVEGQSISLSIFPAHEDRLDLDVTLELRAVDAPDTVLSALTMTDQGVKTLSVPSTSEYFIAIRTHTGKDALLYTLSLSLSLSAESTRLLAAASRYDFVPGEVLIVANEPDISAKSTYRSTRQNSLNESIEESFGLTYSRRAGSRSSLFKIKESVSSSLRVKSAKSASDLSKLEKKWRTLQLIEEINQKGDVGKAEPNYYRTAAFVPNDEHYAAQWSLSLMNMEDAWGRSTGSGVVVAVIDSGINPDHPDLADQLTDSGYDFIANAQFAGDGDGFDSDPTDLGEAKHGSHVAGVIAAKTNNSEGIAGIAFDSRIMPLRVLGVENDDGESQGTDADLANAILYAGGLENDSGILPARAADVINLSLGSGGHSDTLENAIEAVIAKGIIVVAAAGNDASDEEFYPAAFDGVIGVSAIDSDIELSAFSNFGQFIDIAAPGGARGKAGILSTVSGDNYLEYFGTSMAAPHVSGVAALMKSVNPDLSIAQFTYALENGFLSDVIGESDKFGAGLINANKAVAWASGDNNIPDSLYHFPKSFAFANKNVDAKLYLSNPGNGIVIVNRVRAAEEDSSWLDARQESTDSEGLGTYNIEVNSAQIPVNTFRRGNLLVNYQVNGGDEQTLSLRVLASNTISGNETVGNLFVSLISVDEVRNAQDGGTVSPVAEVAGSLLDGVYAYSFSNIPVGEYFVQASTNNDGDPYLFDEGEAIGVYPSLNTFQPFIADAPLIDGIDFSVEFYESNLEAPAPTYLRSLH